ncbi:hypothetical protein P691DRAFT_671618 [Macrolepiota fuliginosa MF-IS2]|uniref:Protein kinase domain-containing protein n=1 Tax=Macrolepiota fuliginosa MF-IS2 TaxID=1400762 RepID=A0A9P5X9M6_9AGAR|nr:hypothetical protein P691DRAFT_671618 [Macrolepiota fuliginosa MF-IS2]
MPLHFARIPIPKTSSRDVIQVALSASSLAKDLSSMAMFPPVTALVSTVVMILETALVRGLKFCVSNDGGLIRLARRCARILLDINEQMEGRWDLAPPRLLRNIERLESVLHSIQEFMQILANFKWGSRFLQKTSIEGAITEYSAQLEDASRSFQLSTLINIHYAVAATNSLEKPEKADTDDQIVASPIQLEGNMADPPPYTRLTNPQYQLEGATDNSEDTTVLLPGRIQPEDGSYHDFVPATALEDRGFRRYHQSDIQLRGRTVLKEGWWSGASVAEVDGRHALIKRYEGPPKQAVRQWLRDIQILQGVFHPSLPQLVGYSDENTPTPFILLSNVQTRSPQNLLQFIIEKKGPAETLEMLLKFYKDITDATLYAKKQLHLDEERTQDFVEGASLRVDASNTVIVAPPPPKEGTWVSFRNYNLTKSLTSTAMNVSNVYSNDKISTYLVQLLPTRLNHVLTLAKDFLPSGEEGPELTEARVLFPSSSNDEFSPELDFEEIHAPKPTLRHLRLINLANGGHTHVWSENQGIPAERFSVGDFGYIPKTDKGGSFEKFIKLGNIFEVPELKGSGIITVEDGGGSCWNWADFPFQEQQMEPYILPGNIYCWPVAVPPYQQINCRVFHSNGFKNMADGWRWALEHGKAISTKYGIAPHEVILVTLSGKTQDFYIRDFRTPIYQPFSPAPQLSRPPFGRNQLPPQHYMPSPFSQNTLPNIMYLFTSVQNEFSPSWSHKPITSQKSDLQGGWIPQVGWHHGYLNWVQLHSDDFI